MKTLNKYILEAMSFKLATDENPKDSKELVDLFNRIYTDKVKHNFHHDEHGIYIVGDFVCKFSESVIKVTKERMKLTWDGKNDGDTNGAERTIVCIGDKNKSFITFLYDFDKSFNTNMSEIQQEIKEFAKIKSDNIVVNGKEIKVVQNEMTKVADDSNELTAILKKTVANSKELDDAFMQIANLCSDKERGQHGGFLLDKYEIIYSEKYDKAMYDILHQKPTNLWGYNTSIKDSSPFSIKYDFDDTILGNITALVKYMSLYKFN